MEVIVGSLLCAVAGVGVGTFLLPLKLSKSWKWENSWLIGAFFMYVCFPVLALAALIPSAKEIYSKTPWGDLLGIYAFGLIQGTGALVFTYGTTILGIALGYALMIGTIAAIGLLVPLFLGHPDRIAKLDGITLLVGCAILLCGIAFSGKAGMLREREKSSGQEKAGQAASKKLHPALLTIIILYQGLANALYYFTFEFQKGMKDMATKQYQVPEYLWGFLNIVPFFLGMFTINLILTLIKMAKDGSLKNYWSAPGLGREYLLAISIGLLWYLGQGVSYAAGNTLLGPLGVSVGAALFMGMMMVVSNVAGVRTGEWQGVSSGTMRLLYAGLGILVAAMMVISIGNYFQQTSAPASQ